MQGGTDSLNSQGKDSLNESSDQDNGDKYMISSRSSYNMPSNRSPREKSERMLGDL